MAVTSAPTPPSTHPINIQAWTAQTTAALDILSLDNPPPTSPPPPARTSALTIDLNASKPAQETDARPRRAPIRRDSQKHREALLKGKEGSRRRRQWENDRLLSNPWAQPPLPSDWEVRPTHRTCSVPYYLASLWDADVKLRAETEGKRRERWQGMRRAQGLDVEDGGKRGEVAKELRERLKRAGGAKEVLRGLEEVVREFVLELEEGREEGGGKDDGGEGEWVMGDTSGEEDEEIVFVGRNGRMRDQPPSPGFEDGFDEEDGERERERLVFRSKVEDQGGKFCRWLVHSIAAYYGLPTWSVTVGDPALREAYVGIPPDVGRLDSSILPRPLWGIV